jgi:Tol biopolymer transport system component
MTRGFGRWLALLLVLPLGACAGVGVRKDELPDGEIALRWYDEKATRHRREAVVDLTQRASGGQQGAGVAVARVDDMSRYMGQLFGVETDIDPRSIERRFPGRLVFFDPRDGSISEVEGARPGGNPSDLSSDGDRLLFTQLDGKYRQLYEYLRSTGEIRRVTRGPDVHADGCYGPGGRVVLLRATVQGHNAFSRLLISQGAGRPPAEVSRGPSDWGPACAPDGSAVAWVAVDAKRGDQLMTRMPPEGGTIRKLGPGKDPSFSADSEWIVYSARVGKVWQLFRIRPDGSGRHPMGRNTLDSVQPAFSPDGRLVVYVSDDGFDRRPYLRRFDGTGDTILLDNGSGINPIW